MPGITLALLLCCVSMLHKHLGPGKCTLSVSLWMLQQLSDLIQAVESLAFPVVMLLWLCPGWAAADPLIPTQDIPSAFLCITQHL